VVTASAGPAPGPRNPTFFPHALPLPAAVKGIHATRSFLFIIAAGPSPGRPSASTAIRSRWY